MTHSSPGCSAAAASTNAGMSSLMCLPLHPQTMTVSARGLLNEKPHHTYNRVEAPPSCNQLSARYQGVK